MIFLLTVLVLAQTYLSAANLVRIFTLVLEWTLRTKSLKRSLLEMYAEHKSISAHEEFSAWAKSKRRLKKLTVEYKEHRLKISQRAKTAQWIVTALLRGFVWAIILGWWGAVFYLPMEWFGPVHSWMKFPFSPLESVGPFYWVEALRAILV